MDDQLVCHNPEKGLHIATSGTERTRADAARPGPRDVRSVANGARDHAGNSSTGATYTPGYRNPDDSAMSRLTSPLDAMRRAVRRPSFWAILTCCVLVYVLVWWLDLTDDLLGSITLTVLVTVMLALEFPTAPTKRPWQAHSIWFAVFLAGGVALLAGQKFHIVPLGANSAVAMIILPFYLLAW